MADSDAADRLDVFERRLSGGRRSVWGGWGQRATDQVINKLATGNEQRLFVELRVGADEAEDDESVASFLVKGTHVAGDIYTVETGVFTGKRVQAQGWVMWVIEPKPLAFFELAA